MKIPKYKIADLLDVSIDLNAQNHFTYNEYLKNVFFEQTTLNSINKVIDSEKAIYYPIQSDEIVFYIKENNIQKFYGDYGFLDSDVQNKSNRLKNTQLRINFFDSSSPSNQRLIHQINLNTQGNEYQRDVSGGLFAANSLPLIFNIETPFKNIKKRKNSLGYGIPFFKFPVNYTLPLKIYAAFTLLNALDGNSHRLYASNEMLTVSNLYQYLYIEYSLNVLNGNYFYTINESNRLVNTIGLKKEITLNILNVS